MKKKKINGILKVVTGIIIAAVIITGGYILLNKPVEYRTSKIVRGSIEETLTVTGNVKSNESKTYYAMFTAPIIMLEAKKGEEVLRGQQLVSFGTEDLSLEAKQSALAVKAAENQYQSTVKQNEKNTFIYQGATMNEAKFFEMIQEQRNVIKDLQEKVSKAAAKQNDIVVLQTRVNMEMDKDNKEDLQKTLDMWKGEYKNMNAPEKEAELLKQQTLLNDMEAYRTQYESQRQTADNLIIDESAQEEILTNKESALLCKKDKESILEEAAEGLQADYDGIISEVYVEEGATVQKGTPLFKLEDSNDMAVEAKVSKYDICKVVEGQQTMITIASHTYQGEITKIDRVSVTDSSDKAKVPVTISIHNPDSYVYLGIEADVVIHINKKENTILVPSISVYQAEEGSYCYVIQNGKINRVDIVTGLENSEMTEVIDGLTLDEKVIIDGISAEKIGSKAKEKQENE